MYNYWNVLTFFLPQLKDCIMARKSGKVMIQLDKRRRVKGGWERKINIEPCKLDYLIADQWNMMIRQTHEVANIGQHHRSLPFLYLYNWVPKTRTQSSIYIIESQKRELKPIYIIESQKRELKPTSALFCSRQQFQGKLHWATIGSVGWVIMWSSYES